MRPPESWLRVAPCRVILRLGDTIPQVEGKKCREATIVARMISTRPIPEKANNSPLKKTLFIRRPGAYGGIEVLLLDWLKHIDYEQNSVFLASTQDLFSEKIHQNGLPVVYKTFSFPVLGGFFDMFGTWYKDIRSISPEKIVIMQGTITEIPLAAVLAAFVATRGNVYMTEHLAWPLPPERTSALHLGYVRGIGLWWYKMMFMTRLRAYLSKRVLAVSEGVRNALLSYGYPPEKIEIAYHGVDVSLFAPSEKNRLDWRRRHDIPENALVLVSTARLAVEKRIVRLIRAFDTLSKDCDELWLLIAGDGPLRKELETLAGTLVHGDRIRFLGLVGNVSELLQASDIFVLPSDREGLSVSLTEAMSTGLLCIASDVSGSSEVIRDGENGFLVGPSDEGVREGLERALKLDPHDRRRFGQNARDFIVRHFDMGRSVANVLHLLDIETA